jgi:hypothetical protein
MEFIIGSEVLCEEGSCGELKRVVANPIARAITHLVVEPKSERGTGRLVPVELVDSAADEIHIRCTMAEFHALEQAEETHFLQGGSGRWGYGQDQMLTAPLFGLGGGMGMGGIGMGGIGMGGMGMGGLGIGMGGMAPQTITEDRVPEGEVQVRRGEHVHATDGEIGRIHGFVIEPSSHHLTHILLDEGHLWGKKTVAIPISAVKDVNAGVRLNIAKAEVGELPEIDLADPLK